MTGVAQVMRSSWAPVLVLLILVAGILLGDHLISSHAYDQNQYHIQVIRQFEAQWPVPDLSDYAAATGPLYHLVLAALGAEAAVARHRRRPVRRVRRGEGGWLVETRE